MTINSDWVEVMKGEVPTAFTPSPPFTPKAAYIDGMPLLMAASTTNRWDDLVSRNFAGPVRRYFMMGAKTVVLAFDDYKFVPTAKSITQANRSKGKAVFDFNERQHLETVMPADYNERLSNRAYKRRVIDLVSETVIDHLRMSLGQRLVIDYVDCPVLFQVDKNTGKTAHSYMTDMPPMGECDVKFTRWARMLGDTIAHSVDGDFIPIALMEYERLAFGLEKGGTGEAITQHSRQSKPKAPPSIAIFRIEYNMGASEGKPRAGCAKKRDSAGKVVSLRAVGGKIEIVAAAGGSASASSQDTKKQNKRRTMEYVNVPLLYHAMSEAIRQCSPGVAGKDHIAHCRMRILAALIGLTGTDFTRNLPQITPKKVWDLLPIKKVWDGLMESFDTENMEFIVEETCNAFLSSLYTAKFPNHVTPGHSTLEGVLRSLHASRLSERTKAQLPSAKRVETTVRNANWLLKYWECIEPAPVPPPEEPTDEKDVGDVWSYDVCFPDPMTPGCVYGFKRSKKRKNAVQWADIDD